MRTVPDLFENNRSYVLGDAELDIIGDRENLPSGVTNEWVQPTTVWAARSSTAAQT